MRKILVLLMLVVGGCEKGVGSRPATGPSTGPAEKRVHVFVKGKVQGVGFRAFTKARADEVGVRGWVKNLLDGRVEAVMAEHRSIAGADLDAILGADFWARRRATERIG